jgi:hypothetical protein
MEYTNDELNELEIMTDDLIVGIFDSKDKRYWINKMLKKAFELGMQCNANHLIHKNKLKKESK